LFPNSVPWQEAFFHTLLHKGRNNAEIVQSQEPTVNQRKWTAQDYKNYEDYRKQQQELELAYQTAQFERKLASMKAEHERAEKRKELKAELKAASEENALRRYKEAFEHASQYGEIISFEYDDKKGNSTVVYRTDDE
jgi:monoamine oxidase